MNVNSLITKDYRKNDAFAVQKNKPNSNPIRTQTKPMSKMFLMPPTVVTGADEQIPWPAYSREIDYELELAVIIGKNGKAVSAVDAFDYVAGYTIANDVSARNVTFIKSRAERNQCLVILNTARITKRPSTSNAALKIRLSCVLGSTNCHIKVQSAATSDMRKTKSTILPNINI
ncbi:MAG: fumarylacetoacetate hydrolase family protein [Planctomycetota bacterium]